MHISKNHTIKSTMISLRLPTPSQLLTDPRTKPRFPNRTPHPSLQVPNSKAPRRHPFLHLPVNRTPQPLQRRPETARPRTRAPAPSIPKRAKSTGTAHVLAGWRTGRAVLNLETPSRASCSRGKSPRASTASRNSRQCRIASESILRCTPKVCLPFCVRRREWLTETIHKIVCGLV